MSEGKGTSIFSETNMSDTDIDEDNPSSLSSEHESSKDSLSSEYNHRSKIRSRRRNKLSKPVKVKRRIRNKVATIDIASSSSGTDRESDVQDKENKDDPEAKPDDKKLLIGYAVSIVFLVIIAIAIGFVLAWQNNRNGGDNDEPTVETGKTTAIPTRPTVPTIAAANTTTTATLFTATLTSSSTTTTTTTMTTATITTTTTTMTTTTSKPETATTSILNNDNSSFESMTRLLVAGGVGGYETRETLILDLSGENLQCDSMAGLPETDVEGATGGLLVEEGELPVPIICGGAIHIDEHNTIYSKKCHRLGADIEPIAQMREPRMWAASVVLNNEWLWITGGATSDHVDIGSTEFVYFDGTVEQGPDLPCEKEDHEEGLPCEAESQIHHCLINIDDNLVFMTGGIDTMYSWVYNFQQGNWIAKPDMMAARESHLCGLVRDRGNPETKYLVALGGFDEYRGIFLSSSELFKLGREDRGWFEGPHFGRTIVLGQSVTTPDELAWIVIGGMDKFDGFNIDFYDNIHKMECTNEGCEFSLMDQSLQIEMHSYVAMLVPDSMTNCA